MALRRTTHFAILTLLAFFAGWSSARAQEGNFKERVSYTRSQKGTLSPVDLDQAPVPGDRPLQIRSGIAPRQGMVAAPASAEFPPPKYKTSGREFFVVFPSIIGNDPVNIDPAKRSLYLASRGRTRVKIKFTHRPWELDTVTVPGKLTIVEIPSWGVLKQGQFENVYDLGIEVIAEDDISIYGYSHEGKSSDGWLILPKESLGQHYIVSSQRNSLNYPKGWLDLFRPRSSMVIGATEDNTAITFKLAAVSQTGRLKKDSVYSIILNRGELFPIMARDSGFYVDVEWKYWDDNDTVWRGGIDRIYNRVDPNGDPDLTGSEVWSDKPVFVYGGHERACSPDAWELDISRNIYTSATGISRDHLTEQMPPVELWGNEFFVMSSYDRGTTRPTGGDVVRVMSAYDNTVVSVNGVAVAVVNANKYYQFMSGEIAHIETSQPALVVKFMQSMKDLEDGSLGDPDMTIVPPVSNLSTAYTLPVVNNNLVFRELLLNVLVHDKGIPSLKINGRAPQVRGKKIAGTDYTWYHGEWGSPGEWRIECDLPCYAESYGYGDADSYTFAGGGDFKYQDSLSAENLDFKMLLIGRSKQLTSNVKAGYDLNLLADSITIYDITWLSGDTTYFGMLDTITTPIRLGPGDKIPVRFDFHPTQVKRYEAKAWVWSSSRSLVYINVVGEGGLMTVDITPKVIDFGRVRVGTEVSHNYSVLFAGGVDNAEAELRESTYPELLMPDLGFKIDDIPRGKYEAGMAYTSSVKFMPMTEGFRDTGFTVIAKLPQNETEVAEKPHVFLRGRGVQPNVVTENMNFGEVRIERASAYREIEIKNIGSDTTQIVSVEMEPGVDNDDFTLEAVSLPPANFMLDTTDVVGSHYRFRARFNPNDTGIKKVRIKIRTLEQTLYSELTGRGVEPYVVATPKEIDFKEYKSPRFPEQIIKPDTIFTIKNDGTYEAVLAKLQQTVEGAKHFKLRPITPSNNILGDTLAKQNTIDVEVTFDFDKVGDYIDTVSVFNDSRNQPLVILRGRVTTDLVITPPKVNFDTIRNCDPKTIRVSIGNPNSVGVVLDTIYFAGDANGFSFGGVPFIPKGINIAPGDSFHFDVQYEFPRELLSGEQHAKVVVHQLTGDEIVTLEIDLEVFRSIKTLSLLTVKPSYPPNVSDAAPFKLPITIDGDHLGLTELDNFVLVLKFDNDLFKPVGIDRVGTLTEARSGSTGSVTYQQYDPATRSCTITGRGLEVSKREGDLLIYVLVRALLTTDVSATVTPELNLDQRPCAYAISKQGILLEYADDCGDDMLRESLQEERAFKIVSARPDPLITSSSSSIKFAYHVGVESDLECEVVSVSGVVVAKLPALHAPAGDGVIELQASDIPATGMYVLRVKQITTDGEAPSASVHNHTFRAIR